MRSSGTILLIVLALAVVAVLWFMGSRPALDVGWNLVTDVEGRSTYGIT